MLMRLIAGVTYIMLVFIISCNSPGNQRQGISKGYIEFREESFSFGEVKHGEVVGHRFRCYNRGNEPVTIIHVEKSCGCTEVIYPQEPVMPGDSAFIELVFDTKGWSGRQVKQVKVLTNDSIGVRELRIWADVQ